MRELPYEIPDGFLVIGLCCLFLGVKESQVHVLPALHIPDACLPLALRTTRHTPGQPMVRVAPDKGGIQGTGLSTGSGP